MSSHHETATYTHGHHESVLRSHSWRTAQNSAAYLLPHLKPDMKILDVGCGPGTITADFAALVPQGSVLGLEYAPQVLEQARQFASSRNLTNITFTTGDVHNLAFEDGTFDVVHAHQVLQHVGDPVQALREMKRVTKKGGIVASRESDFGGMIWYPESSEMTFWQEMYHKVARANGGEPDAGRHLFSWVIQAGFEKEKITSSIGSWCFYTDEDKAWWSGLWADRTLNSSFKTTALEKKVATQEDLERISRAWRRWGAEEDAWFGIMNTEIIARI